MPPVAQPPQSEVKLEPHEIELKKKRELLARVRSTRDTLARQGNITGQNPSKVYIWVNVKEDRQTFFQAWGYMLCADVNVKSPFKQADNSHRRADVVLYEIDRDLYEAIQADNQIRGLEGIEGHKHAAIEAMHRQGVREFIPGVK